MWRRFYLGELALTRKIVETAQRLKEPTRHTGVLYVFVLINNRGAFIVFVFLNNRGVLEKSSTGLIFQLHIVECLLLLIKAFVAIL